MKKCFTAKTKFWKVMKICTVQAVVAMVLCGIALAHDNLAQVLDKKVTLTVERLPLEEALKKIETIAEVRFFYSLDQLEVKDEVSFSAQGKPLRELLDELLQPHDISYKVHETDKVILLKKEVVEPDQKSSDAHPEIEKETQPYQSEIPPARIIGKVIDASTQQALPGVNIIVKGTTRGTTTDADGNFAIDAEDNDVLVFSFIGFKTVEERVNGRVIINVNMESDVMSLKVLEVNAGYWKVKKEEQTGNISKITSQDIEKQPIFNALSALQARVPGLEVIQSTGVPGGNFKVRIRGQNSISSGNDPLYIIDGVPFISNSMSMAGTAADVLGHPLNESGGGINPMNGINPNDIESIEILKDADATAIYGSRGANGVILIATKNGKAGRTKFDLNFYKGAGQISRKASLLSTQAYLQMRNEAFANDGVTPQTTSPFDPGYAPDLLLWDTTRFTDWQEELIGGTAHASNLQLSVSGGDKLTQFMVSGDYHRETTVFPGDNSNKRFGSHLSLVHTSPNQKFKTQVSVNYSENSSELPKIDLTYLALSLVPVAPKLYSDNKTLNWENNTWSNPMSYLNTSFQSKLRTLVSNVTVSYSVLKNLDLKTSFGYTNAHNDETTKTPKSAYNPAFAQYYSNVTNFSTNGFRNWIIEPQLLWNAEVRASKFQVLIGTTFLSQESIQRSEAAYGFVSEALMDNIMAASTILQQENNFSQYRYHAVFTRINYTHSDKYLLNITARRDGSSRFGANNQFANFGAIGAGWILSRENFFSNLTSLISFAKVRASYGLTGNDQIGDYAYFDVYQPAGTYLQNSVLKPVRLSNPNFSWETNRKLEFSLELGFIKDKLLLDVSYYRNRSSDQLVGFALPPTTGFANIQGNLPAIVENKGLELGITAANIDQVNFSWSTYINLSIPRNRLVSFPGLEASPSFANRLVEGEPLTIRKLFHSTGINEQTGIYEFEDTNGDQTLSIADRNTVKNIGREFYGGIQNTLRFKNLQLDFTFQFVKQVGNNYMYLWGVPPGYQSNQPALVMDRWTQEGSNGNVQAFTSYYTDRATAYFDRAIISDLAVSDASFIRLKNLSVSYSFNEPLISKAKLQKAKIFVQSQNLLTITNYEGIDPEHQKNVLPPIAMLTAGINLTF